MHWGVAQMLIAGGNAKFGHAAAFSHDLPEPLRKTIQVGTNPAFAHIAPEAENRLDKRRDRSGTGAPAHQRTESSISRACSGAPAALSLRAALTPSDRSGAPSDSGARLQPTL